MSYATRSDLDVRFGEANIDKWADLDNDESEVKIAAVVAARLADAEAYVNSRLRRSVYAVPFSTVPQEITEITALIAGARLYEPRRLTDDQDSVNQTVAQLKRAEAMLNRILAGTLHLNATQRTAMYPTPVPLT